MKLRFNYLRPLFLRQQSLQVRNLNHKNRKAHDANSQHQHQDRVARLQCVSLSPANSSLQFLKTSDRSCRNALVRLMLKP